jgi:DNA-binding NarL/FixJ family response regulator
MQQTLVREQVLGGGWGQRGLQETAAAFPMQARAGLGQPTLSVTHINGCLVIGQARTDITELHPQPLSFREKEVLALVAEGNGNKEIAACLRISERTVKNHLTGIMTKLRASDRTHAVVTAIRLGWLAI